METAAGPFCSCKWIPSICAGQLTASNLGVTETRSGWFAATFAGAESTYSGTWQSCFLASWSVLGPSGGLSEWHHPFIGQRMMVMMSIRFALGRLARMVVSVASKLSTQAFSEVNSQDPCLIDNPVWCVPVLGARDGQPDIIHPAGAGRAPRIAVRYGVFVRIAVVGKPPLPS